MTLDERINRYLDKCEPAISGSSGHHITFKVACALVNGFALNAETALAHLTTYNAKCCPPWKPRELRHKIDQAGKVAHEKARGHLLGQLSTREKTTGKREPKLVPVRQKAESSVLGRLGRSPIPLASNAGAHTHIMQLRKVCTVPTVPSLEAAQNDAPNGQQPSQASQTPEAVAVPAALVLPTSPDEDGLLWIPGCAVRRAVEIEITDTDWRAVVASGLAEEPLIQYVLWLFPGSTVVSHTP